VDFHGQRAPNVASPSSSSPGLTRRSTWTPGSSPGVTLRRSVPQNGAEPMPQPDHISALSVPDAAKLDDDIQAVYQKCREKLGLVPNVLRAMSFHPQKLRNFMTMYNELMLGDSKLSKLEREMVAVVVSSANRCYYCLVAHGQAVRRLSGDPELGEMMALNYRVAKLSKRQRALLHFAWKLTMAAHWIGEPECVVSRAAALGATEIFDPATVVAFFNLSNRMAFALDMMPTPEYHRLDR